MDRHSYENHVAREIERAHTILPLKSRLGLKRSRPTTPQTYTHPAQHAREVHVAEKRARRRRREGRCPTRRLDVLRLRGMRLRTLRVGRQRIVRMDGLSVEYTMTISARRSAGILRVQYRASRRCSTAPRGSGGWRSLQRCTPLSGRARKSCRYHRRRSRTTFRAHRGVLRRRLLQTRREYRRTQ